MSIRRARRRGMVAGALISKSRASKSAKVQSEVAQPAPQSNNVVDTDQLVKLAELRDSGILTQEEFDAKKKQILGL